MEFLIASFGTSGDVLPVIRLGAALRAKGHRVGLVAAPSFAEAARAAGLDFVSIADEAEHRAAVRDFPLLMTRYRGLFIRRHAVAWNERLLAAARTAGATSPVMLSVERPYLWADLYVHARWGAPCLRLVPDPPLPRHWRSPARLPSGRVQAALTSQVQCAWSARLRTRGWQAGPEQIVRLSGTVLPGIPRLGLWPSWIASRGSRPQVARAFGFIMNPEKPPRTRTAGDRPLLLFVTGTTGTIGHWEAGYLHTCVGICGKMNCEGILLGATEAALRTPVPPWFRCERFTPLERLLPNAAAIVHHGGIGTSALALYHAVPQLIVPRVSGQPVNAELMRRLGVARVLEPDRFGVGTGVALLEELLGRESYRQRAAVVSGHLHPAHDLQNLAAFIEDYGRRAQQRPNLIAQPS